MKKNLSVAIALLAVLGFGMVAVATAKTKKVTTTVSAEFFNGGGPYDQFDEDRFVGKLTAKKGCKKRRKISIPATSGSGKSDNRGNYAIGVGNANRGTYEVRVARDVRRKKNGVRIVCKKANSDSVAVRL